LQQTANDEKKAAKIANTSPPKAFLHAVGGFDIKLWFYEDLSSGVRV
jgi:hypothetical protein